MSDYKLLLVNPRPSWDSWWNKTVRLPPNSLISVASTVPKNWEVKIIDENVQPLNPGEDADLVGITSITSVAPDAYRVAKKFRERGIPVIMGGIHATACPEEALDYVDCVIAKRVEGSLPQALKDFENGKLERLYQSESLPFDKTPSPRHDLLDYSRYTLALVEASRGCPYDCKFCSVSIINDRVPDYKNPDRVVEEIRQTSKNRIMLTDDNIYRGSKADRQHLMDLLIELKKLRGKNGLKWTAQAALDMAKDEEILRYASESGLKNILVGIETLSEENYGNKRNPRDVKEAVKRFHEHGISVQGTFIFGWDSDDKNVFEETTKFIEDAEIDSSRLEILTPLPGTVLYTEFDGDGRIFREDYPTDWSFYNFRHAVFYPKNMTPENLELGTLEALAKTCSLGKCLKRGFKTLLNTKDIYATGGAFLLNYDMGITVRRVLKTYR